MTRLLTAGWESGAVTESGPAPNSGCTIVAGRLGGKALQISDAGNFANIPVVAGRNYYSRFWFKFPSAPTVTQRILVHGANGIEVLVTVGAAIQLTMNNVVMVTTPALATNQWHRVEVRSKLVGGGNPDEGELIVNGVNYGAFAAVTGASAVSLVIGRYTLSSFWTAIFDDVAVNDNQGANENSWPNPTAKIVLLKPVADGPDTGSGQWRAGNGINRFNLYDAVDNIPPIGKSHSNATVGSQIYCDASIADYAYDAILERYDSKLAVDDKVAVVQAVGFHGSSSSPVTQVGIQATVNPVAAEGVVNSTGNGAGTFPTDWATVKSAVAYGDVADRATAPVLRVLKKTNPASTLVCFMGLNVEVVPPPPRFDYNDAPTATLRIIGSCVDALLRVFTDHSSGNLVFTGTIVESYWPTHSDTPTGALKLTGSAVAASVRDVAPAGTLTINGASTSKRAYSDLAIGALTLVGTCADEFLHGAYDRPAGALVFTGSCISDHFTQRDDSPLGDLSLTGRVSEFWAPEGSIFYDDFPQGLVLLAGVLITPGGLSQTGLVMHSQVGRIEHATTGRRAA